jgi:eukaryotic-like serine/threonine-protein kinase
VCQTCGNLLSQDSAEGLCPRCLLALALDTGEQPTVMGKTVIHYRVVEPLGGGGMGLVYKAVDTRLGRSVALKFLPAVFNRNSEVRARFHREARIASSLNHPHICTVYDVGEFEGSPFIVMELLEGQTLSSAASRGPVSIPRLVELAGQISDGLAAAHRAGIIHRDIKPANIFVTPAGGIKILDFGLAREQWTLPKDSAAGDLTLGGVVLGTVPYMSPEQVEGRTVDHRTDLFSLGTLLYEIATGESPFLRDSPVATLHAIVSETPRSAISLRPDLPRELSNIIDKLQAKDPDQRFQTADDLSDALGQVDFEARGIPRFQGTIRKLWRPWRFIPLLVFLLLLAVLVFIVRERRLNTPEITSVAVLPFENLSGDPELEFVADGMTDALSISLARLGGVRVPSRTSVMQFKGQERTVTKIAQNLHVDAVVEGAIRTSEKSLFIDFSLVAAKNDEILRSGDFRVDRRDFGEIQNDIAHSIAEEIQGELSPETERKMRSLHPSDPVAYESFMKGLYLLNERASLERAVSYFRKAAAREPGNALVHAYLAHAYLLSSSTGYGASSPALVVPEAKWAAQRALEIDGTLPEAHAAMGMASFSFDWDWRSAEKHFQRAIEVAPDYATAYHWYGLMLAARGDLDAALANIRRAKELEPYSPVISTAMGRIYYYRREYEQAERYYDEALELERDFVPGWLGLGLLGLVRGQYDEALAAFHEGLPPQAQGLLRNFAAALQNTNGPATLHRLSCEPGTEGHCSFYLAVAACIRGQRDEAFEHLEQAYQAKSEYLVYLKVDPVFDPVRPDPRYRQLLARLGLDEQE